MSGAKNSIQHVTLLLSVFLFSVDPVSSIKCYVCSSTSDKECIMNPKNPKFAVECKPESDGNTASTEFQCLKWGAVPSIDDPDSDEIEVNRACVPKGASCEPDYLEHMPVTPRKPFATNWCDVCDSDLCNSTALTSAEIWMLILSLTMHLQTR